MRIDGQDHFLSVLKYVGYERTLVHSNGSVSICIRPEK
jgi:hypothetical protein